MISSTTSSVKSCFKSAQKGYVLAKKNGQKKIEKIIIFLNRCCFFSLWKQRKDRRKYRCCDYDVSLESLRRFFFFSFSLQLSYKFSLTSSTMWYFVITVERCIVRHASRTHYALKDRFCVFRSRARNRARRLLCENRREKVQLRVRMKRRDDARAGTGGNWEELNIVSPARGRARF